MGDPLVGSVFTLAADTDVWGKLFLPSPPAMYHDIFSLIAIGEMKFEGNIQLVFQQLSTLAEWVRVGRELNGEIEIPPDPEYLEEWQAVGRYTNVVVDGCRHKVFISRQAREYRLFVNILLAMRIDNGVISSRIEN